MNDLLKKWDSLSDDARKGVTSHLWSMSKLRYDAEKVAEMSAGRETRTQLIEDVCEAFEVAAMIFEGIELGRKAPK